MRGLSSVSVIQSENAHTRQTLVSPLTRDYQTDTRQARHGRQRVLRYLCNVAGRAMLAAPPASAAAAGVIRS